MPDNETIPSCTTRGGRMHPTINEEVSLISSSLRDSSFFALLSTDPSSPTPFMPSSSSGLTVREGTLAILEEALEILNDDELHEMTTVRSITSTTSKKGIKRLMIFPILGRDSELDGICTFSIIDE